MTVQACEPLKDLLGEVLSRLAILEAKVGVVSPLAPSTHARVPISDASTLKPTPVRALSVRSRTYFIVLCEVSVA
jgi:hypothetical protein